MLLPQGRCFALVCTRTMIYSMIFTCHRQCTQKVTRMDRTHISSVAHELNLSEPQVCATAQLLSQNATIPFIARYRKELTGSLDEVAISAIRDRLAQLQALAQRRQAIVDSLAERKHLTPELEQSLNAATTLSALEDIYLPFRPKRRTRAIIAREKGLEPLAALLLKQENGDPQDAARAFINPDVEVNTPDEALQGARDIIAEQINENAEARARLRSLFQTRAMLSARVINGKEDAAAKYRDYFAWEEPVRTAPSHRVLAIRRGEQEQLLLQRIQPDEADALAMLESMFVRAANPAATQVCLAVHDGYKRLLSLSMETEIRLEIKQRADTEAIAVFSRNLRQLLRAPPLGRKRIMAIDPGFRTGCKVVCLDDQGQLLHTDTIYPHTGKAQRAQAAQTVVTLCRTYGSEVIAVGNGTAGRETEAFLRSTGLDPQPAIVMVNESGASVYSASAIAREEFPQHDVTVRGAVSIGRRLMDPLAELVKIDPKSIGVGQYQHDVDQKQLRETLDACVMSCVNQVGVEVNTASVRLLTYVSGIGPKLAGAIVAYRDAHGPFMSRAQLKNVPGLGPRAFEQAAGFLRIRDGAHPLDASAVHPERYPLVERMASDCGCSIADLMYDTQLRTRIELHRYTDDSVGLPTLADIMTELAKPGRDPRARFEPVRFADGITAITDLSPGMQLAGVVTNITNFGAFVDIGVHQDGLVHISQLADRFVKDPAEVVSLQQQVTVTVLEVDVPRTRISLSMRTPQTPQNRKQ